MSDVVQLNGVGIDSDRLQVNTKLEPTEDNAVAIKDGTTPANKVSVTASGQMQVALPTPATPSGKTPVIQSFKDSVGSGGDTQTYVIPNGETLTIQYVACGADLDSNTSSNVTLYYAPNGSLDGSEEIIADFFVSGRSDGRPVELDYVGDGTAAIILYAEKTSGGSILTFRQWQGYY